MLFFHACCWKQFSRMRVRTKSSNSCPCLAWTFHALSVTFMCSHRSWTCSNILSRESLRVLSTVWTQDERIVDESWRNFSFKSHSFNSRSCFTGSTMDEIKLYASKNENSTFFLGRRNTFFPTEITGYTVRDDVDKLGISVVLLEMEV